MIVTPPNISQIWLRPLTKDMMWLFAPGKQVRKNIPAFNRVGNWIFKTIIRKFYGFTPYDPMTGLYGVRKQHLLKMELTSKRFTIEPEVSIKGARMNLRMLDIPTEYKVRAGRTKLNAIKVGWEDTITILSLVFWRLK